MDVPFYNFQFLPIAALFKFTIDPNQSIKRNKTLIFSSLFEKARILKEIVKEIEKNIKNPPNLSRKADEKSARQLLENLSKKLVEKIKLITGDTVEEDAGTRTEQEEEEAERNSELDSDEYTFFLNALEFIVSGTTIPICDEDKTINELGITKTHIIQIKFDIENGFEERENHEEALEEDSFFLCEEHGEKTTHYCRTCKKLICAFEFIPMKISENPGSFF